MEKENKNLLIKDLYSRFPYGVICEISDGKTTITEELKFGGLKGVLDGTLSVKPYLRPLSSMTEEEKKERKYFITKFEYDDYWHPGEYADYVGVDELDDYIDWLNVHRFDYRGLIEKGLALEAPENMYLHFGDKNDIEMMNK